jgi:hypothetical protein
VVAVDKTAIGLIALADTLRKVCANDEGAQANWCGTHHHADRR